MRTAAWATEATNVAAWEEGRPDESGPLPPRKRDTEALSTGIPRWEKQTVKKGEEVHRPLKRSQ